MVLCSGTAWCVRMGSQRPQATTSRGCQLSGFDTEISHLSLEGLLVSLGRLEVLSGRFHGRRLLDQPRSSRYASGSKHMLHCAVGFSEYFTAPHTAVDTSHQFKVSSSLVLVVGSSRVISLSVSPKRPRTSPRVCNHASPPAILLHWGHFDSLCVPRNSGSRSRLRVDG